MDFNQTVNEKISPLFIKHGFILVEHFQNVFRFQSIRVEVNFSYNKFDKTNIFQIGKKDEFLYTLNDNLIIKIFGSEIKIEKVSVEAFVDNVVFFLTTSGSKLLMGDEIILQKIKTYCEEESKNYTDSLLDKRNLIAANKAWEKSDYKEFIKIINQSNIKNLPSSILLKYKIAKQKI
jgi:hypothetical protein